MKKYLMILMVVWMMVGLSVEVCAADIDFGAYKVLARGSMQGKGPSVRLPDGRKIVDFNPYIYLPKGAKGHRRVDFVFAQPTVEEKDDAKIIKGKRIYKGTFSEAGLSIEANIEMDYQLTFYPKGKVSLRYEFLNKGDEVFLEPFIQARSDFALLKEKEYIVKQVQENEVKGTWSEEVGHGCRTARHRGGGIYFEPQAISATFNTTLGKPIVYSLSPGSHLRVRREGKVKGDASIKLYNFKHFAATSTKYDWKPFLKNESFVIEAEIILPVEAGKLKEEAITPVPDKTRSKNPSGSHNEVSSETAPSKDRLDTTHKVDSAEYISANTADIVAFNAALAVSEEKNNPARPEAKNGTFYIAGRPVFLTGAWLASNFSNANSPVPIEGYKDDPAYGNVFNYEIAEQKGFSTCHPQVLIGFLSEKFTPDIPPLYGKTGENRKKNYYPTFIKKLKSLPLVVDYAMIKYYGSDPARSKLYGPEINQQNKRWHTFVPFCPEHPAGMKIYKAYWQEGAKVILENGGNPWIYELFNQPAYDCRCEYNKSGFVERLKQGFGTIEGVNKTWGSSFNSFEEIVKNSVFERQKGLWVDWIKFNEDKWCEVLKEGMKAIREVDKREKIYFSSQRNTRTFLSTEDGFDEYKNARVLDVINTEGGTYFNLGKKIKSDDPMDAHLEHDVQISLDCCRAVAEGKPIIGTENHTSRRDENNKRLPSKRSDQTLMLWNHAMHGSSSTQIYSWTNRKWQWPTKDLAGAEKFVKSPRTQWAGAGHLNPYCYPKETLEGIKDFKNEIEKLADIVLPRPRIKGKVALLLSNPSRRYTKDIKEPFITYYKALVSTHYPLDIIFEEQLKKGWAGKYKAVISPFAHYTYNDTAKELKKYVQGGGVVILQGMDLAYDEYGKAVDNNDFIGLAERTPISLHMSDEISLTIPVAEGYPQSIKCKLHTKVVTKQAQILSRSKRKIPQVTCNKAGKGRVYYLACKTKGLYLGSILAAILKDAKVEQPFVLRGNNGELLPEVEAQLIDRGDKKLYYFVNWTRISELGALKVKDTAQGNYYLTDPVTDILYLSLGGKRTWTGEELSKGINLFLPAEERVLLLLTKDEPTGIKAAKSQSKIETECQKRKEKDETEEKELEQRKKSNTQAYIERNKYLDTVKENCFPIDISNHCNMGFKDDVSGDKKGGAFDQGAENDLHEFPVGRHIFSNVPFSIIDPEQNRGKSMIVLRGRARDYFPLEVSGIQINKKIKHLYFLHTIAWEGGKFAYTVNYGDGDREEILIKGGEEVGGWWGPSEDKAPKAKIAWEGKNSSCARIGAYCYRWRNPKEDLVIKTMDIKSYNLSMVPAILAITGEK